MDKRVSKRHLLYTSFLLLPYRRLAISKDFPRRRWRRRRRRALVLCAFGGGRRRRRWPTRDTHFVYKKRIHLVLSLHQALEKIGPTFYSACRIFFWALPNKKVDFMLNLAAPSIDSKSPRIDWLYVSTEYKKTCAPHRGHIIGRGPDSSLWKLKSYCRAMSRRLSESSGKRRRGNQKWLRPNKLRRLAWLLPS